MKTHSKDGIQIGDNFITGRELTDRINKLYHAEWIKKITTVGYYDTNKLAAINHLHEFNGTTTKLIP